MPCYQVVTVSVEFKVESKERLEKALQQLGYDVRTYNNVLSVYKLGYNFEINLEKEKINFQKGNWKASEKINEIKREYSKVSLEEIAKKKKWILKNKGANKFQMIKY